MRKLDAILSKVYKADPVKYAAWKAARHVERAPVAAETAPNPEGEGTTPASGS